MFKVLERIFRDKIATENISLTGSERLRGKLTGQVPGSSLPQCQAACPVGAFQVQGDGYEVVVNLDDVVWSIAELVAVDVAKPLVALHFPILEVCHAAVVSLPVAFVEEYDLLLCKHNRC